MLSEVRYDYTHYHCVRIFFLGGGGWRVRGGVEPIPKKTIKHRLLYNTVIVPCVRHILVGIRIGGVENSLHRNKLWSKISIILAAANILMEKNKYNEGRAMENCVRKLV
jgi:hypothetical protein